MDLLFFSQWDSLHPSRSNLICFCCCSVQNILSVSIALNLHYFNILNNILTWLDFSCFSFKSWLLQLFGEFSAPKAGQKLHHYNCLADRKQPKYPLPQPKTWSWQWESKVRPCLTAKRNTELTITIRCLLLFVKQKVGHLFALNSTRNFN